MQGKKEFRDRISKGPWHESPTMSSDFHFIRYITDDDGRTLAEVRYAKGAEQDENLANAKLMSKSPEMFEMLEQLERWMSGYGTVTQSEMRERVRKLIASMSK